MKLLRSLSPDPGRACGIVLVTVLTVSVAGCDVGFGSEDGRPRAVASFYPLQYVAQRIVGEHADVANLTSPGAEPHDLELTVQDTAEVADADLALYERGLQPAFDAAIEQNGPERVLDVTDVVDLESAHRAGDDTVDPDLKDLHFWLNPIMMVRVADEIRIEMSQIQPKHAKAYRANYESLRRDLEELDRDYEAGLATCEIGTVVVSHDAFGYLGRYGLRFEAVNGLSPDAEPSPAHIAQLHDLIESEGVTTVFSETLASPELAGTLADDLGIETGVLDPIEGLGTATADEDYLSLMRENLAALQNANRCS